jgi:HAD superfamily phosphoserine phosphatase-like hydrolase
MDHFVSERFSPEALQFIDEVLRLEPKLAVFDCDGTLWSGDAGEGFFDWELKRGIFPDEVVRRARARYADYRAGKVPEDVMCGEMVTLHRGLPESQVQELAREYFESTFVSRIFPELQDLIVRLKKSRCKVWAVSSSNIWIIRAAAKHFAIDEKNILAAAVEIDNGIITDRVIRVPSGEGKPLAIREVIARIPDAAFGNSRWDTEMLAMAKSGFAVNPNPDLKQTAETRGWTIYQPEISAAVR